MEAASIASGLTSDASARLREDHCTAQRELLQEQMRNAEDRNTIGKNKWIRWYKRESVCFLQNLPSFKTPNELESAERSTGEAGEKPAYNFRSSLVKAVLIFSP